MTQSSCCPKCVGFSQNDYSAKEYPCRSPNCPCHKQTQTKDVNGIDLPGSPAQKYTPTPVNDTGWSERFTEWWNRKETVNIFVESSTNDDFAEMAAYIKTLLAKEIEKAEERGKDYGTYSLEEAFENGINAGRTEMKEEILAKVKDLQDNHCCHYYPCDCGNKMHLYCGCELNHGIELETIRQIISKE